MTKYCQLQLTCKDTAEADSIANALLVKHLIACAKQVPVSSDFIWQGKIDHSDEILLIMDSKTKNFEQIEAEVKRLHSYETFNLQAVAVEQVSEGAASWLDKEVK